MRKSWKGTYTYSQVQLKMLHPADVETEMEKRRCAGARDGRFMSLQWKMEPTQGKDPP